MPSNKKVPNMTPPHQAHHARQTVHIGKEVPYEQPFPHGCAAATAAKKEAAMVISPGRLSGSTG